TPTCDGLCGGDGSARGGVLVASSSPRPALPARRAPAPERDPRRVGATPCGARPLAGDGGRAWPLAPLADRRAPHACAPAVAPQLLRLAYPSRLRLRARAPGLADPPRACRVFRDGNVDVVATRPRHAAPPRLRSPRRLRVRRLPARLAPRPAARAVAETGLRLLRRRPETHLGTQPAHRPGARRGDDGVGAGPRPLRRLLLLVPPLPRRGRRY